MIAIFKQLKFSDLWQWDGLIDRGAYLMWGLLLFALKFSLDSLINQVFFHRHWSYVNYLFPGRGVDILNLSQQDQIYYATMLALALPFIWTGVVLTIRRLRATGMAAWLAKLFFIPVVNLLLFVILCLLPSEEKLELASTSSTPSKSKLTASDSFKDACLTIAIVVPIGAALTFFGASLLRNYGWGLFVGIPFVLGMTTSALFGRRQVKRLFDCYVVSFIAMLLLGIFVLVWAWEGVVCLMMASPIAFALAIMGATLGYFIQRRNTIPNNSLISLLALVVVLPAIMGAEYATCPEPPLLAVRSHLLIHAPIETVWHHVVSFADLPPPKELLFKTGIAYPKNATIEGHGVGAIRRCNFSTGAFVEPIRIWDEPHQLRFGVEAQPMPMHETSLYKEIHPAHLNGYLKVRAGEFLLTAQGGQTLLQGTTWYQNKMWPMTYWRIWSDYIIEHIHLRVLRHIKNLCEIQGNQHISNRYAP